MRRSLAQGQPVLPEFGPLCNEASADRFRRGMRPMVACTWCSTQTVLTLAPGRGQICPVCDRAPRG